MLTMNCTQKCNCARQKLPSKNFCNDCWARIPDELKAEYERAFQHMHNVTLRCTRSIQAPRIKRSASRNLGKEYYEKRLQGALWSEVAAKVNRSYNSVYKLAATYAAGNKLKWPI